MNEIKNYGFIPPSIKPEEWIFGALDVLQKPIRPDGQWGRSLPIYEPQADPYETWGCTIWGGENQTEIYTKEVFGFEPNYDERRMYNIMEIDPPGANPQDFYEAVRKFGLTDNELMPDTYEEFRTPRPVPAEILDKGKPWLLKYELTHKWLFYPVADLAYKQKMLQEALQFSPIGVSVLAWKQNNEGLYFKEIGEQDSHWCVCYGYDSESWHIFDSYDHSKKRLALDYDFGFAKSIHITRKPQITISNKCTILKWINKLFSK